MNLEKQITKNILEWPILFLHRTFKNSRLFVLDHLFNIVGNGYTWHKESGQIQILDEKVKEKNVPEITMTEKNFKELTKNINKSETAYHFYKNDIGCEVFIPYPINYKGNLHYIPDNIENSWLKGAEEILIANQNFYYRVKSKTPIRINNIKYTKEYCESELAFLESIKKRIEILKEKRNEK